MQKITIVKVGGKIIDHPAKLSSFLDAFSKIAGLKILVHGGGTVATQLAQKLGIKSQIINGRRITDAENLKLVTMVYAGLVNKNIVAQLQSKGINAMGICGADLNLIEAKVREHKSTDYGFVGDIKQVNSAILHDFIKSNIVPVLAPITHNGKGQLLNTNADTVATELAITLNKNYKVKLIYSFEKNGVLTHAMDDSSQLTELNQTHYEILMNKGIITEGMLPKTQNAFYAHKKGVSKVIIGNLEAIMTQGNSGTLVKSI